MRLKTLTLSLLTLASTFVLTPTIANVDGHQTPDLAAVKTLDIPAQPLAQALKQFAHQTGLQLAVETTLTEGQNSPAIQGAFSTVQALEKLLEGTGLRYEFLDGETVAVSPVAKTTADAVHSGAFRFAQSDSNPAQTSESGTGEEAQDAANDNSVAAGKKEEEDAERGGIPEILVTGSKLGTLNMDIERSMNDIQPYVVYGRDVIENSSAVDLEEFFRGHLTAAVGGLTNSATELGNRSSVNLRGLGTDETLILVDGRRMAQFLADSGPGQPNINAIPLASIERIEVLPTTASGIYGGSATGGVINIVLRRDYSGFDAGVTYSNTFESDVTNRRFDVSTGFNLLRGRTNVLFTGSYSDTNPLLNGERNFLQRGRRHIIATNPSYYSTLVIPPSGATPNIRSITGENLTLDDGTSLNSPFTSVPKGYAGVPSDSAAALVSNAGSYNLDLPESSQDEGVRAALLAVPETKSAMVTIRHELTPRAQVFVDLQASDTFSKYSHSQSLVATIAAGAPNNPFQQDVLVNVPTVGMYDNSTADFENRRATIGLIVQLPKDWRSAVDLTWDRSRNSHTTASGIATTVNDSINAGLIDVVRDVSEFPITLERDSYPLFTLLPADSILRDFTVRFAGPLPLQLPAGKFSFSALLEHRDESFSDQIFVNRESPILTPSRSQNVSSLYLETTIPIISAQNRVAGAESIEFQIATRYDDYRVVGSNGNIDLSNPVPVLRLTNRHASTDPTIGFKYQPMSGITFRSSYGTGYRPPRASELVPNIPVVRSMRFLRDPLRGNESLGLVTLTTGGNPDLLPESSESLFVGAILTPSQLVEGLRMSADWSRISKRDNIARPFISTQDGLNQAVDRFPERVIRGEPSNGFSVGPIIGLNDTQLNIASLRVEALDLAFDYEARTQSLGVVNLSLRTTRLISAETRATANAPVIENAGAFVPIEGAGGPQWRANAMLNWEHNGWSLGWRTRFFDTYFLRADRMVNLNQGEAAIPSQVYHDLFGSYRFPTDSASVLSDVEIRFGIDNLFDKEPPIDVGSSILGYSLLGDPRLASYYISLRRSFGR